MYLLCFLDCLGAKKRTILNAVQVLGAKECNGSFYLDCYNHVFQVQIFMKSKKVFVTTHNTMKIHFTHISKRLINSTIRAQ